MKRDRELIRVGELLEAGGTLSDDQLADPGFELEGST